MKKILSIVSTLFLISGCASYQPMNKNGTGVGYQDIRLGDSSYQLRYVSNYGISNEEDAWNKVEVLWNQRATEICRSDQYLVSDTKKNKPCREYLNVMRDKVVRENRCLLELQGTLTCDSN
ncbi:MAG: hypothetical protein V7731_08710 [Amphritea sp.]